MGQQKNASVPIPTYMSSVFGRLDLFAICIYMNLLDVVSDGRVGVGPEELSV